MYIRLLTVILAGASLIGSVGAAHAQAMRVAISPIAVNSVLPETEYLSTGLADMITARLEQSGQIAIVRLGDRVSDRSAAIEAGKQAGAEFVLFGSYTQFGDGASLDMNCVSVSETAEDTPRRVFIQAGSPAAIIPKLSDLSEQISRYLVGASVSAPAGEVANPAVPPEVSLPAFMDLQHRVEALETIIQSTPNPGESAATE